MQWSLEELDVDAEFIQFINKVGCHTLRVTQGIFNLKKISGKFYDLKNLREVFFDLKLDLVNLVPINYSKN